MLRLWKGLHPFLISNGVPPRIVVLILVTFATGMTSGAGPLVLKYIVDWGNTPNLSSSATILWLTCLYIVALVIGRVAFDLLLYFFAAIELRMHARMRLAATRSHLDMSVDSYLESSPGRLSQELANRTRAATLALQTVFLSGLPVLVQLSVSLAAISAFVSWTISLSFLASTIAYVFAFAISTKKVVSNNRSVVASVINFNKVFVDLMSHFESIRTLGAKRFALTEASKAIDNVRDAARNFAVSRLVAEVLPTIAFCFSLLFLLGATALERSRGQISAGDFAMIAAYALMLFKPIEVLGVVHRDLLLALNLLGPTPNTPLAPESTDQGKTSVRRSVRNSQLANSQPDAFNMTNVAFVHAGGKVHFTDLNFSTGRGQTTLIVGESGVGKSTLGRLAAGVYMPRKGIIRISGEPAVLRQDGTIYEGVGMLPQDTAMFDLSLRDNILLGRAASTARIEELAERLALEDLVGPGGRRLDEMVGPMGGRLSLGEKRRIGLIRMALAAQPVIILDEPLASLDSGNAERVAAFIKDALPADCAKIIITHDDRLFHYASDILELRQISRSHT
jgi:ATP-binding cassette subfamily B protein